MANTPTRSLTDREFWIDFWRAKAPVAAPIGPDHLFASTLQRYLPHTPGLEFIEIGGFPGFYSVFFAKYYGYRSTLLDRYVDREVVSALAEANRVHDVDIIEADFFTHEPTKRFDVVMSSGFIEHFDDLPLVVSRHAHFLRPGGHLVLSVPNFLGLNGIVQRVFDRTLYAAHNLDAMDLELVLPIVRDAGVDVLHAGYEGRFAVWIEEARVKSSLVRNGLALLSSAVRRMLPFESKVLSPFTLIIGRKRDA